MADMKDPEKLSTRDIAGATDRSSSTAAVAERPDIAVRQKPEPAQPRGEEPSAAPLFASDQAQTYRSKWDAIQTAFVDEPRHAVEQADSLVAEVMKRLAEVFAREREQLEQQWDRGDKISTEDLRLALRKYRSFFERLLKV